MSSLVLHLNPTSFATTFYGIAREIQAGTDLECLISEPLYSRNNEERSLHTDREPSHVFGRNWSAISSSCVGMNDTVQQRSKTILQCKPVGFKSTMLSSQCRNILFHLVLVDRQGRSEVGEKVDTDGTPVHGWDTGSTWRRGGAEEHRQNESSTGQPGQHRSRP